MEQQAKPVAAGQLSRVSCMISPGTGTAAVHGLWAAKGLRVGDWLKHRAL